MDNIFHTELKRAFINKRFILVFILAGHQFHLRLLSDQPHAGPVIGGCAHRLAGNPLLRLLWFLRGHHGRAALRRLIERGQKQSISLGPILLRTSYKRYLCAKTLAVAISGAAAVLLPAVLMLGICYLDLSGRTGPNPGYLFQFQRNLYPLPDPTRAHPSIPSVGAYAALMPAFPGTVRRGLRPAGHGAVIPDPKLHGRTGPSLCHVLQLWLLPYPHLDPSELDEINKNARLFRKGTCSPLFCNSP